MTVRGHRAVKSGPTGPERSEPRSGALDGRAVATRQPLRKEGLT
jgi:hypothetical protein